MKTEYSMSSSHLDTEQCLLCSSREQVSGFSCSPWVPWATQPQQNRKGSTATGSHWPLGRGQAGSACWAFPPAAKTWGELICVSNTHQSERNKKHQLVYGLGSLQPSVLCGKLQGVSEHPFMLWIPKLKCFTLGDNFEIFISIHLCKLFLLFKTVASYSNIIFDKIENSFNKIHSQESIFSFPKTHKLYWNIRL